MNWSKAKSILIVVFIITNLFLLYVKIDIDNSTKKGNTVDDKFVQMVVKELEDKDIKIDCEILNQAPVKTLITIEYESYSSEFNKNKLASRFFNSYAQKKDYKEHTLTYKSTGEELILYGANNVIEYRDYRRESKLDIENINQEKLENMCKDFLKRLEFNTDDMKLTNYTKKGNKYNLHFTKFYNNMLIEDSYMIFEIDQFGIKNFKRKWLEVKKEKNSEIKMGSPQKALLRLLSRKEAYGKSIVDMSMCYYFSSRDEIINHNKQAKEGDAVPAWRVKMNDGELIILEEY
ncbi:two-component system regulatory protein YycI [Clostridiaceae bacterium M8S5]|nr:two-component system regulatory protein YycI [Clostridiaceae bacterium M8S5]